MVIESPRVLSFIVTSTLGEARHTVESLKRQKLHTEIYTVIGLREGSRFAGEIVTKTINAYLKYIDLSRYDFLLKSDNDVLYSSNFLKANCRENYDLMGVGAGLLIRVEPFLKYCGGRFVENDLYDTILFHVFNKAGLKVLDWKYAYYSPIVFRKMKYGARRSFNTGKLVYDFNIYSFKRYAINRFINGFRESPFRWFSTLGFILGFIFEKLTTRR